MTSSSPPLPSSPPSASSPPCNPERFAAWLRNHYTTSRFWRDQWRIAARDHHQQSIVVDMLHSDLRSWGIRFTKEALMEAVDILLVQLQLEGL